MNFRGWTAAVFIAVLTLGFASQSSAAVPKKIDFNRDVRPILSANCFYCHGHDPNHREAKLRLDTKEGLFGVIDDVNPIVPGNLDDSVLYQRITSDDEDARMPAKKSNKHLTPEEIETIRQWIVQGATWAPFWAYEPPKRPALPANTIPGFNQNPIDTFVVERLNEVGLHPSPEANRDTLIRRLSLDLTGLPPTPAEVSDFVHDTDSNAYEKVVSRLLASPHYGERMSVYWMDLVRYADTIGYHSDNPREIWPWRDWLINAFNNDEPFDQMTIDQLAGDLVPNATREQKVASGYNRLLLTTGEGGAQAKEYIAKYAADRVRNISSVWLGSTMACCECHDHKFDPFSQKDFYSMEAFFADIQEPAISLPQPELLLPNQKQQEALNSIDAGIAAANAKLGVTTPEIAAAQAAWEKKYHDSRDPSVWTPLTITEAQSTGGATLTVAKDGQSVLASGKRPPTDVYVIKATSKLKGITALRVEALPHDSLPAKGPGRADNGNFVLSEIDAQIDHGAGPTTQPVAFDAASASFEQTAGADASPYKRFPAIAAIDGDKFGNKIGWAVLERTGRPEQAVFQTASDLGSGDALSFTFKLHFDLGDGHALGNFRLSASTSPRPVRASADLGIPPEVVAVLDIDPTKRTPQQLAQVAAHYRSIAPQLDPVRAEIASLTAQRNHLTGPPEVNKYNTDMLGTIPRTLISVAGKPRIVRILPRGNWQDDSGEIVTPHVPHFLRQLNVPENQRATRLDLARWLVARDNPLVARVYVNRLWYLFYGKGLAEPLNDMGSQGDYPTHPELLDWLATEFMDSGWDIKHMVRLIVSSGAYRQNSIGYPQDREADPFNHYVARQGTFRLDAEFIRDNALSIAGLLSPRMFGPSVRPYQPAGYWEFLNFPKRDYDQDHGESLYRRGVYTWWQRTFLNPSLLNFDAPSHEECTAERSRSNTPQQALTLLNDPTYVEAARVFAEHIIQCGTKDPAARIKWAYNHALSRDPLPAEQTVLTQLLDKHEQRYSKDKAAAEKLDAAGEAPVVKNDDPVELAAWTSVARTILNLHETITRN